jgi:hypothetical protein
MKRNPGKRGRASEAVPIETSLFTEDGRNLAAVLLGRRGGLKGGKARAKVLPPERRKEIARKAAEARWSKK